MSDARADAEQSALVVIHRYLGGLFEGRPSDVFSLYGTDAEVIRYEGVAGDDTIAWEATIETNEGPIQTSDVFVLSPENSIGGTCRVGADTGVRRDKPCVEQRRGELKQCRSARRFHGRGSGRYGRNSLEGFAACGFERGRAFWSTVAFIDATT
jgi:hypothetical protein